MRDESSAYLEFLNEEVSILRYVSCIFASNTAQAQKFRGAEDIDSEDDLGEESLILDSPLDKIDSYQLFAATMHSKFESRSGYWALSSADTPPPEMQTEQPQFYTELCRQITADDMTVIQGAITKAEQTVMEQMALAQQQGANLQQQAPANGGAS